MCEICGQAMGHHPRCPDYDSKVGAVFLCQKCGEGIRSGEKALIFNGQRICTDCVEDMSGRELLESIGIPMHIVDVEELIDI